MLTPAQAEEQIRRHLVCLPIESLPLTQCVGGVLRENIYAERDQPPFDRVTMDGIAVDSAAVRGGARRLRVQALQAAGDAPLALGAPYACIEIMTGAVLPAGTDAVVPIEQVRMAGGFAALAEAVEVQAGANVHRRGSDSRQGTLLLEAGTRLGPPEIAVAAGAGLARIRVSSQPAIAVLSTGNELIEPGEPILPHQLRRSNVYAVVAALRRQGFQRVADDHVRDDAQALEERLTFHLHTHDVLVLSGGVSMGKLDLVPAALERLGVRQVFHKVAQRPGKPFWFGVAPGGGAVFALPGNPVSTLVCLARYVLPALLAAMGQETPHSERIGISQALDINTDFWSFTPVRVQTDEWGRAWAQPRIVNTSGDFQALAGTDGFVELPPGPTTFPKGFVSRLYRW